MDSITVVQPLYAWNCAEPVFVDVVFIKYGDCIDLGQEDAFILVRQSTKLQVFRTFSR